MTAVASPTASPSRHATSAPLTGPILLAIDGSADSDLAARAAVDLASGLNEELHVVHCWLPLMTPYGPAGEPTIDVERDYKEPASELLRTRISLLEHEGATVAGEYLLMGPASEQVPALAAQLAARLIVIGSRGLGAVKRLVLGSVSEGVVHTATTPVLVVRGGSESWPPTEVLVGDDGSEPSHRAADVAAALARATGARFKIATVIPVAWSEATSPGQARAAQAARTAGEEMVREAARQVAAGNGMDAQTAVLFGDPAAALVAHAAAAGSTPSLIAVGSRGLGAIQRLALGSTSTKVLRGAHGPVLIWHPAG